MSHADWTAAHRLSGDSFASMVIAAEQRILPDVADQIRAAFPDVFADPDGFDASEAAAIPAEFTAGVLLIGAYNKADMRNSARLEALFPKLCAEVRARWNTPGGRLAGEQ